MTKRDFFRVLIKLFGLYAAITATFNLLPTYIGYVVYDLNLSTLIALLIAIAITSLALALIFGADKVIDWLKLDRGYDEDRIEFGNLKDINILKLAIIVIGLLLVVNNSPTFFHHCYLAFKDLVTNKGVDGVLEDFTYGKVDYFQFSVATISIIIGFLMITNFTTLGLWLLKANKKNI